MGEPVLSDCQANEGVWVCSSVGSKLTGDEKCGAVTKEGEKVGANLGENTKGVDDR